MCGRSGPPPHRTGLTRVPGLHKPTEQGHVVYCVRSSPWRFQRGGGPDPIGPPRRENERSALGGARSAAVRTGGGEWPGAWG